MKQFDYYEFTAILVPGAAFLMSLGFIFPDELGEKYLEGASLGDLGIFVIASYVAGHILQAFGNIYERIVWKIAGGQPTEWILNNENGLLSSQQTKTLKDKIQSDLKIQFDDQTRVVMPLTRQVYIYLKRQQRTARVDIFNANYGLNRALAAAVWAATLLTLPLISEEWPLTIVLGAVAGLLTYRMYDFGICYARELYLEFLVGAENTSVREQHNV